MGAERFFDYSEGADIGHAYQRAVDTAFWRHGHEGYTGSICEKAGWVLIPRPRGVSAEKVGEALDLADKAWAWDTTSESTRSWLTPPTSGDRAIWDKVQNWWGPKHAREIMDTYNDKWGPAIAIGTTGADKARYATRTSSPINDATRPRGHQLFAFFGWASS